jgi:hypothetical protein
MSLDKELEQAAEDACGEKPRWEGFVPVTVTAGETVWQGIVSFFDCDSGRVYAWQAKHDPLPKYVAVVAKPPIASPGDAVRAWLAAQR